MTIGLCTSTIVLPHDALPPVRAMMPAIRSGFDVYLLDDTLVYAKEPCVSEDVDATFFLHVDPIDPDDLPSHGGGTVSTTSTSGPTTAAR